LIDGKQFINYKSRPYRSFVSDMATFCVATWW